VSGASAWINSQIPSGTPGANGTLQPLSSPEKLVRNFLTGTTTQIIRMAVYGQGKLDFASIAADAFGNAIGDSMVSAMQERQLSNRVSRTKELLGLAGDGRVSNDVLRALMSSGATDTQISGLGASFVDGLQRMDRGAGASDEAVNDAVAAVLARQAQRSASEPQPAPLRATPMCSNCRGLSSRVLFPTGHRRG
jgi:hypothetical protein